MVTVWGIHNDTVRAQELIDGGYISIGWDELGDLSMIGGGREGLRAALAPLRPDKNQYSIGAQVGTLLRFRDTMAVGDIVVAADKVESTISIGEITGPYEFHAGAQTHRSRRPVTWKKTGISRTVFTRPALNEAGSALTTFEIKRHRSEFLAALATNSDEVEAVTAAVEAKAGETADEDVVIEEPRASQIERQTRDFVLEALHKRLSARDFEEFTADLFRALGYQARATQYVGDGGIDVIAHRDPLGVEPPQIKVQCKHTTNSAATSDVTQLKGVLDQNEYGVFITLGSFPTEAKSVERQNSRLRLMSGEDVVTLVMQNYERFPSDGGISFP